MTDHSQDRPTQGRRRRQKSPASVPSTHHLPLPRLLDHLNVADGPSEAEEEEKDAKRPRSASTTPRTASETLPHEYDMVMGIAPVEPQESERLEEGNDSDFQDAEETTTREPDTHDGTIAETLGAGEIHGGYGSATLRERLERALQHNTVAPAALHSGEGLGQLTNPPQVMSPNVEQNLPQDNLCEATTTRRCVTPSHKSEKKRGKCDTQVRSIASWS